MNAGVHLILDALQRSTASAAYPAMGLFDGLAGAALFQFQYGKYTGSEEVFDTVAKQVETITTTPLETGAHSFGSGEAGIKWLKGNTEGWANFLACLKAYLEYGINLRKGAFDFMKES